jgi:methyl-accepting chemotaxis protein
LVIENTAHAIFPAVLLTNLITLGLISLATILVLLFLSHKLAGPLFRFEKEIREIATGDLSKQISLRKNDQIKEMAESLNLMTTSLRLKLLVIQKEIAELSSPNSGYTHSDDVAERLKQINNRIESEFKL